ncbi:DUF4190 domain-containing protein [Streptomyces sp. NPDC046759]|uniref:DUF4190 domain-containing protein n=1 Tax=Streptomyces sp. NPDC046759 TaxID=3155019 RepID=UPI0033FDC8A0
MSDEVPQSTPHGQQPAGEGTRPPRVSLGKPDTAQGAGPTPAGDSVHYQETLTSLPGAPDEPADAVPSSWAPPVAGPQAQTDPFAPPAATPPANPYAPPAGPANGYAPPAQHAGPAPVPPPPVAPEGPGRMPYGYPGAPSAYGYPGQPQPQPPYAGPYPAAPGYGWPGMPMVPQNGMGIAAMVLGILSLCLFCMYGVVSVVLGILAVVFGIKGRRRADRGEATNRGQAQAGLIMGIIGIVIGIAVIVLLAIGITAAVHEGSTHSDPYDDSARSVSVVVATDR